MVRSAERHHRSLAKALSWRVTGSIDTFIIAFIVTGKLSLAAPITLIELVSKVALYYLHERVWSFVGWGRG